MAYTVKDHGTWERYVPDSPIMTPLGLAGYSRRVEDGFDWYDFARDPEAWTADSVKATCDVAPNGQLVAQAVYRDPSMLFPQSGQRLIEILGVSPDEPFPHKLFEQRPVNLASGEFGPRPAPPAPRVVTYKLDLWTRATDTETETIVAGLALQPLRRRKRFEDSSFLDHADEDFADLRAGFVVAFGETRTAQLLAPSA